jgi:HEPN domain-containing protein
MNRSADWLHQAQADLEVAGVSAALAASVSDLEDRLRILDALYIPTRYPDSLPDGAPTDHHCCTA